MSIPLHHEQTGRVHRPVNMVADSAARTSASYGASDLYKFYQEEDTGTVFQLMALSPLVWRQITGAPPVAHVHSAEDITTGTLAYARLPVGTTTGTVAAGDDPRMSDARTPLAHEHSADDISSGTLAYARLPVGTTAATVAAGDDPRMTDARTPVAHVHPAEDITSGTLAYARLPVGTATGTVAAGDDPRLSDARTPLAHTHDGADIVSGTINRDRIPTMIGASEFTNGRPGAVVQPNATQQAYFLRGDGTWQPVYAITGSPSAGDTTRFDGSNWIASGLVRVGTQAVGIGVTTFAPGTKEIVLGEFGSDRSVILRGNNSSIELTNESGGSNSHILLGGKMLWTTDDSTLNRFRLPRFSSATRDGIGDWSAGALLYNLTTNALEVRLADNWNTIGANVFLGAQAGHLASPLTDGNVVIGSEAILLNDLVTPNGATSVVIGKHATACLGNVAIGANADANSFTTFAGGIAIGQGTVVSASGAVAIGDGITNNVANTVRIAHPLYIGNAQVLGPRIGGWTAATGTATRTGFSTSTVTLQELAEHLKALLDDLVSHGLIGA